MKKGISILLAVLLLIGSVPLAASALVFDGATGLPELTQPPVLRYIYVNHYEDNGRDTGIRVYASWENSEELAELAAQTERYAGYDDDYVASLGYEDGDIETVIQLAYSFDGGTNWVNDFDWEGAYTQTDLDTDDDGINEYENLPQYYVNEDVLCDYEKMLDLTGLQPQYYGDELDEASRLAANMTQGAAHFTGTGLSGEEWLRSGFSINFNTNTLLVKARYRICSVGYTQDDSVEHTDYSEWSEPLSYNNNKPLSEYPLAPGGVFNGPQLSLLATLTDGDERTFRMRIQPDAALAALISSSYTLYYADKEEDFYGPTYDAYTGYTVEAQVNDGSWYGIDWSSDRDHFYESTNIYIADYLLNAYEITLQPGDRVKLRVRFLSSYDWDDNRIYTPDADSFAHSAYSNVLELPMSGFYRIEYRTGDGDFKDDTEQVSSYGEDSTEVIDLTADAYKPVRYGYEFAGWYTDEDYAEGTELTELDTKIKKYWTLYAKWATPGEYKLTYVPGIDGAYNPNPDLYTPLMNAIQLEPAEYDGVEFEGWYTSSAFADEEKVTVIDTELARDITLYAKWKLPTYSINYVLNGGTNAASNPVSFQVNLDGGYEAYLAVPTKTNETFDGWYYDSDLTDALSLTEQGYALNASENVTVYAKWILGRWAVHYIQPAALADVYNPNPETYTYGDTVTLAALSETGYSFDGWFTDAAFSVPATDITATDTGEKTFYAAWAENEYDILYVLDANPQTSPDTALVVHTNPAKRLFTQSVTLSEPSVPSNRFFKFLGWYNNVNFEGDAVTALEGNSTAVQTLYAKWQKYSWGDVDFDGAVTASDARAILRAAVGLETLSDDALLWGNVDIKSVGLTAADARTALRLAVKLDTVEALGLPEYPEGF